MCFIKTVIEIREYIISSVAVYIFLKKEKEIFIYKEIPHSNREIKY